MKKYIFFLLIFLTLTTPQCIKITRGPQLPPITTWGANTFGCLVNGNVWLPYSYLQGGINYALWVGGAIPGSYYKNQTISITANNTKTSPTSTFDIVIFNLKDTGTYEIQNTLSDGLTYSDGTIDYAPVDTFGTVKILRLDTIADIVSGTFSFRGTNTQFNKTVNITNGRFDVHWPYKQ